jgi:hypothetical protein
MSILIARMAEPNPWSARRKKEFATESTEDTERGRRDGWTKKSNHGGRGGSRREWLRTTRIKDSRKELMKRVARGLD